MVDDIARILPALIERGGIYNVCDDEQPSFRELEILIAKQLEKRIPPSVPYWMAKSMALVGDLMGNKAPINSLKLKKNYRITHFFKRKSQERVELATLECIGEFYNQIVFEFHLNDI